MNTCYDILATKLGDPGARRAIETLALPRTIEFPNGFRIEHLRSRPERIVLSFEQRRKNRETGEIVVRGFEATVRPCAMTTCTVEVRGDDPEDVNDKIETELASRFRGSSYILDNAPHDGTQLGSEIVTEEDREIASIAETAALDDEVNRWVQGSRRTCAVDMLNDTLTRSIVAPADRATNARALLGAGATATTDNLVNALAIDDDTLMKELHEAGANIAGDRTCDSAMHRAARGKKLDVAGLTALRALEELERDARKIDAEQPRSMDENSQGKNLASICLAGKAAEPLTIELARLGAPSALLDNEAGETLARTPKLLETVIDGAIAWANSGSDEKEGRASALTKAIYTGTGWFENDATPAHARTHANAQIAARCSTAAASAATMARTLAATLNGCTEDGSDAISWLVANGLTDSEWAQIEALEGETRDTIAQALKTTMRNVTLGEHAFDRIERNAPKLLGEGLEIPIAERALRDWDETIAKRCSQETIARLRWMWPHTQIKGPSLRETVRSAPDLRVRARSATPIEGATFLHAAAAKDDAETVHALAEQAPEAFQSLMRSSDQNELTPLGAACMAKAEHCIEAMVEHTHTLWGLGNGWKPARHHDGWAKLPGIEAFAQAATKRWTVERKDRNYEAMALLMHEIAIALIAQCEANALASATEGVRSDIAALAELCGDRMFTTYRGICVAAKLGAEPQRCRAFRAGPEPQELIACVLKESDFDDAVRVPGEKRAKRGDLVIGHPYIAREVVARAATAKL